MNLSTLYILTFFDIMLFCTSYNDIYAKTVKMEFVCLFLLGEQVKLFQLKK